MWTAIVGFSGTGKTPGIDVTKRALARIARDRKGKIVGLELAHETRVEAAKLAHARWKAEVEAAAEAGQPPPQMPAEAINPGPFNAPASLYLTQRLSVSRCSCRRSRAAC